MQPKTRILDLYGTFVRDVGGWISIRALVELMAPLGIEPQAVRSATSRMKRRGLLASEKREGLAGYRLTPSANQILQDGDSRIFRDPRESLDDFWVVALYSVPEEERSKRYAIRSRLNQLGFAQGPAGSWFAPASVVPETRRMLEHHGLDHYVSLWRSEYLGFGDLETVVADAWDFATIRQEYSQFIALVDKVKSSIAGGEHDRRQAFVDYLDIVAAWRPLPYLDPGLPASVTPPDWPRGRARALFEETNQELRPPAMRYFVSIALPAP